MEKCIIKNCKRDQESKKHSLCWAHLQRYYRHGKIDKKPLRKHQKRKPFENEKEVL